MTLQYFGSAVSLAALLAVPCAIADTLSPAARDAFDYARTVNYDDALLIDLTDSAGGKGEALLTIMPDEGNVQSSNFDWRSFQLTNTGDKRIAAVFLDVTDSIFSDVVFDADGSGGDDVAKDLSHDWGTTETKPIAIDRYQWQWLPARDDPAYDDDAQFNPSELDDVNNLFVDELSDSGLGAAGGFRGELILFEDFTSGDTYEFSGDMDPNSLAGLKQGSVGLHANWDVGGVSGAEMIGGVVTVLFGDGTTASGTIAADGSQAGSVAFISDSLTESPGLSVEGVEAGESGTYSSPSSLSVVLDAPVGSTVLVSMVQAFDPVDNQEELAGGLINIEDLVNARLQAQYPTFPVNNAKVWRHEKVFVTGSGSVDISSRFDLNQDVKDALAFVAAVIDPNTELPISKVSSPIRLLYAEEENTSPETGYITCRWGESYGELSVRASGDYPGLDVAEATGSLSDEWDLEPVGNGYFRIRNRLSGRVLTRRSRWNGRAWVPNSHVDVTRLRSTWWSQQWKFDCGNDGWCRIVNRWGSNGYLNRHGVFENNTWQPKREVYLTRYESTWWSQQWRADVPN